MVGPKNCRQGWEKGFPFGPKGFGRGFHGFGPGGFGAARWERGDLKLVILDLLANKPRHGYDIIQELEKAFHGFYSPSPGSVYPILQLLEDQGLVTSDQQTGKKVYSITGAGKAFLKEHAKEVADVTSRMGVPWEEHESTNLHDIMHEVREVGFFLFQKARNGELTDSKKREKLKKAIADFKKELYSIFSNK